MFRTNWPKHRAWGWYATLIRTPWFCVKILRFKPRGILSVQRHKDREELWVFLRGRGRYIEMETYNSMLLTNRLFGLWPKSHFLKFWRIKKNRWHTFAAHEDRPAYILEMQYGRRVSENDIERKKS